MDYLLPILLMLICVVHIIKTGRNFLWVYAVIFIPLLGALAYFVVEIIPSLFKSDAMRRVTREARAMADPAKSLRDAKRHLEMNGSVDARRQLAEEYIKRGNLTDAIQLYEEAMQGAFADDPALLMGLARARFLHNDGAGAQNALDHLQQVDPSFISADAHLLYARTLEQQQKWEEAAQEYKNLVPYYPGEEARGRYAQLLESLGRPDEAQPLYAEILKMLDGAPTHYISAQKEWGDLARRHIKRR